MGIVRSVRQWRRFTHGVHVSLQHLHLWCVVLLGLSCTALLLFFFFSPLFSVTSIRVSRQDKRIDVGEVQQLLLPYFGRHLFFLSLRALERRVLTSYPEISHVQVRRNLPGELHLILSMDVIVAEVVLGDPEASEAQRRERYEGEPWRYVTADGVYLEYDFPLEVQGGTGSTLKLYVVDWAVKPTHRQQLLGAEFLHTMQNATNVLRESFRHTISSITLYLRAQEFHVHTDQFTLWFDLSTPLPAQLERYRAFLRTFSSTPAQEYVDLRLHDRVVYR